LVAGCSSAAPNKAPPTTAISIPKIAPSPWTDTQLTQATIVLAPPPAPQATTITTEHWYFESLSSDGKRALLRKLDVSQRSSFHVRVVDVESGKTLEESSLPELAKIPASTIGGKATDLAALEWMLASPAFVREVGKGARIASAFPFGECGRLAAAPNNGSAIAFDAGDWLYVADEHGRAPRRLVDEAAYDPRFTPDGKNLIFRRANGSVDSFAKYELFVVPTDFSQPPRSIPNTAGVRDRFTLTPDGASALAVSSQTHTIGKTSIDTCVLSIGMKQPFQVKKLACIDGNEQLVESVISPKGKWAALSTKKRSSEHQHGQRLSWRLRVVSLTTGKVMRDEPDVPGLSIRAISDAGLLVQSGSLGVVVHDIAQKKWRSLTPPPSTTTAEKNETLDLGHRGFFRNDKDLVYVTGETVAVLDVSKE